MKKHCRRAYLRWSRRCRVAPLPEASSYIACDVSVFPSWWLRVPISSRVFPRSIRAIHRDHSDVLSTNRITDPPGWSAAATLRAKGTPSLRQFSGTSRHRNQFSAHWLTTFYWSGATAHRRIGTTRKTVFYIRHDCRRFIICTKSFPLNSLSNCHGSA